MPRRRREGDSPAASRATRSRRALSARTGDGEAVAEAQRVEGDDAALSIGQRASCGAAGQGRGVLEAARDTAAARAPERAIRAADQAERDPQAVAAGDGEHGLAQAGGVGRPLDGGRSAGGDLEHDQVAVGIDAPHGRLLGAAIGEGDRGRAITEVVGTGQDLAGGDHDAGAPMIPPDGDGGGAEAIGGHAGGLLEFVESGHEGSPPTPKLATCELQVTIPRRGTGTMQA